MAGRRDGAGTTMEEQLDAIARRERRRQRIAVGSIGVVIAIACLLPHSERGLLPWERPAAAFAAVADRGTGWRAVSAGSPVVLAAAHAGSRLPILPPATPARAFPAAAIDYAAVDEPVATPMSDAAALPLAALASAPARTGYFALPTPGMPTATALLGSDTRFAGGGGGGGGGITADETAGPRPGGEIVAPAEPNEETAMLPMPGGDVVAPLPTVDAIASRPGGDRPLSPEITPGPGGDASTQPMTPQPSPVPAPVANGSHEIGAPSTPAPPLSGPAAPAPASVPEPGSWALLLIGFAAVAGGMRRRARGPLAAA